MALDIASLRNEYIKSSLNMDSVEESPFDQFTKWLVEAHKLQVLEPNAMILSTADRTGKVTQRTVLLKGFDKDGFVFYTNYHSQKAKQISDNRNVSVLFPWLPLERQVIVTGQVEKTSREESERYFKSRPYNSQLGALASEQSAEVPNRAVLEDQLESLRRTYKEGEVPMPDHWGGFRIVPQTIEFWQGRPSRLHDRIMYELHDGNWTKKRLSP